MQNKIFLIGVGLLMSAVYGTPAYSQTRLTYWHCTMPVNLWTESGQSNPNRELALSRVFRNTEEPGKSRDLEGEGGYFDRFTEWMRGQYPQDKLAPHAGECDQFGDEAGATKHRQQKIADAHIPLGNDRFGFKVREVEWPPQ